MDDIWHKEATYAKQAQYYKYSSTTVSTPPKLEAKPVQEDTKPQEEDAKPQKEDAKPQEEDVKRETPTKSPSKTQQN